MSEICFNRCVWDFDTDIVRNREERCVLSCTSHYLTATKEIGKNFGDAQANQLTASTAN